jgi:ABC-2 type transport system ATP-binding protein
MPAEPALVVENLTRHYRVAVKSGTGVRAAVRALFKQEKKDVRAVAGISFTVAAGEMVAFLGPNGAGKTTTLKMLAGLIYPTSGTARVLGHVPWERTDAFRRLYALVMGQKNQLWWDLPARESFRLHREIYSIPAERFRQTQDDLIALLSLGKVVDQPVRELSLGERMKLELVAALLHAPRVLFLDEPTIGLDVVAQTQLRDFLREHNRKEGTTALLTSHYMKDVESLCQRALVVNHGKLVCDESLESLSRRFGTHKIVTIRFGDGAPADLSRQGEVLETRGPVVKLRVERSRVPQALSELLANHIVADVTVDEVPLEEVLAEVFRLGPDGETAPAAGAT